MRITSAFVANSRVPLIQAAKTLIAIGLSWALCVLILRIDMPIFAAIAALLIVAPSVNQSFAKGVERSLGVVAGVLLASVMAQVLPVSNWLVLLIIAVAVAVSWMAKLSVGMTNQLVISAMLAIAMGAGSWEFAVTRVVETAIGSLVAFGVNLLLVPPVKVEPARERVAMLGGEIAESLVRLADALESTQTPGQLQGLLIEVRLLRPMVTSAQSAITTARESLSMNLWAAKHEPQLQEIERVLDDRLRGMATEVIGMTRAFFDHYDDELCREPMVHDITDQLRRAAHDVRLLVHLAEIDPTPMTSAIPALTAPLELRTPSGRRWILIGSLMEDLRRIHERLAELDVDA
ncbi:FUSC family protein [Gulosibacter bifidus]|uniref:Aromatic acid exporter family protein n=1 Tax=Gulosibacter bifidus TaxID=272239 RepID=A0ABW5RJI9_9MICO|nr:FUSC family protein [Gulosibacter bifidus]